MAGDAMAGNGNSGEGLVDVHAIELFTIGVEAHHTMVAQELADLLQATAVFQLQAPKKTVAADGQQQVTQTLLQAAEQFLQVVQKKIGRASCRERVCKYG